METAINRPGGSNVGAQGVIYWIAIPADVAELVTMGRDRDSIAILKGIRR